MKVVGVVVVRGVVAKKGLGWVLGGRVYFLLVQYVLSTYVGGTYVVLLLFFSPTHFLKLRYL